MYGCVAILIIAATFPSNTNGQLQAQSCSISCPGNPTLSNPQSQSDCRSRAGPPGKRGASGPPGPPGRSGTTGLKGDKGEAWKGDALADEVAILNESILSLKDTVLVGLGWLKASNDHWYRLIRNKMNFAAARALCKSHGGRLAHAGMKNSSLIREVISLVGLKVGEYAWIGLSDIEQEGVWVWDDGSNDPVTNWRAMEPSGSTNENCGHFYLEYKFNDIRCDTAMHVLCETVKL